MGKLMYLKNVTTLELDEAKCIGCGKCEMVCPQGVMILSEKRSRIVNKDACMECGACAMNCRSEAISVQSGVGCANAIINGFFREDGQVCCGPSDLGVNRAGCCC